MIKRFWAQLISAILVNGYLPGFITGKIFTGRSKNVCLPVLNCYSCPGALGSCPIGAAQAVIASSGGLDPTAVHTLRERVMAIVSGVPFFVIGMLAIGGAFVGRATCGWMCPFGFLQDLMHRLPGPKLKAPGFFKYGKYLVTLVLVILLPLLWVDQFGGTSPTFCQYLCPAGTLQGGILLPILNPDLRSMLGKLFVWKFSILVLFLIAMVLYRRPFCSWACPIGAFLGPFNRVSRWQLAADASACTRCGACEKRCVSGLRLPDELDSAECVRCLECVRVCPHKVIRLTGGSPFSASITEPPRSNLSEGSSPKEESRS